MLCVLEEEDVLWPGRLEDCHRDWWYWKLFDILLVKIFHGVTKSSLCNVLVPDALLFFLSGHF